MRKRRQQRHTSPVTATQQPDAAIEAFSFASGARAQSAEVFDYLEAMHNGRWYEPPLFLNGCPIHRAGVHHASAIQVKRNILRFASSRTRNWSLAPSPGWRWTISSSVMATCRRCRTGSAGAAMTTCALVHPARTGLGCLLVDCPTWQEQALPAGRVGHVMEADINQEIYGIPDYVGGLNSTLLNGRPPCSVAATMRTAAMRALSCTSPTRCRMRGHRQAQRGPAPEQARQLRNLLLYTPAAARTGSS